MNKALTVRHRQLELDVMDAGFGPSSVLKSRWDRVSPVAEHNVPGQPVPSAASRLQVAGESCWTAVL